MKKQDIGARSVAQVEPSADGDIRGHFDQMIYAAPMRWDAAGFGPGMKYGTQNFGTIQHRICTTIILAHHDLLCKLTGKRLPKPRLLFT